MSTTPLITPRASREQRAFRALLDAMSRPGSVHRLESGSQPGAAILALFEALVDHEVSFAVVPPAAETTEAILRLTGRRLAPVSEAAYVLATGPGIEVALANACTGDPEYPDRGATVIAVVESLAAEPGPGLELVLQGPGINGCCSLRVAGLPPRAVPLFLERNAEVPLGVDLVLLAPDGRLTCLPRYTRIQEAN